MATTPVAPIVILSTLALASLVACRSGTQSPADPSTTSTTSTTAPAGTGGIGQGADPMGMFPVQGSSVTSGAPASPMEGGCREGSPRADARDLDACLDSCRGKDDTVPLGSRCISAKASCTSQCDQKFAK